MAVNAPGRLVYALWLATLIMFVNGLYCITLRPVVERNLATYRLTTVNSVLAQVAK